MAIDPSTGPDQKNSYIAPSQAKITLVIGIAVVALISGFIAFSRYDWMLGTNPPNEEKQKEFLDLAKQMPEVNSFLKKYPHADEKIDLFLGSTSNTVQPYLPSYNAIITYSSQKWNNKGEEWETSLAIHVDKENPTDYNINGNTYSSKAFHGYYYTAVPQCIAYGAGTSGSIPGFPEGTNMAYLSKDCSEVEILPH